ncbi:MAG: M48 family metallopeptidase [Vicinamibacterales bacterium]
MTAHGFYYDGRTSRSHAVTVAVEAGIVHLRGEGVDVAVPVDRVELEPALGSLPRRLDLPDGASCLVDAAFELPDAATAVPQRVERWANELEVRWWPALLAAAAVMILLWGGISVGVPVLARVVAARMHPGVEQQMGSQALATLDRMALAASELPEPRREALRARFAALADLAGGGPYVLEFRKSPAVGPNAFALPGGTVVLLDELVATARADDEIVAVLAHEIGHLHGRHTMRHVLQTSVAGVLVAAVVGDVLSLSSYAAALPAFLLDARYSRDFEREADRFGLDLLDRAGVDRGHFVRFLTRMEQEHPSGVPGFLSTHPRAEERGRAAAP